jgi:CheY-like chemotaxis protein
MHARAAVILLVEDDPDDVLFLKRALQKARVRQTIRVVRDGEECVQYLKGAGRFGDRRKHPLPCLIILDLKLPKMDGLEILRWIREHDELRDLPVLMVSASGETADRAEAERNGVEAYHVKPVSFAELVRLATEIRERADDHCKNAEPCPSDIESDP